MTDIIIIKAGTTEQFEQGKILFQEYADSLDFDLGYQRFDEELRTINRQYNEPEGVLLLCFVSEMPVGCVGIRKFDEGIAELKRLFVKPEFRSLKIGKQLLALAIASATKLKYRFLRLDTVRGQTKAQQLYRRFGFYEIAPYRPSPIAGTMYFEKNLVENS